MIYGIDYLGGANYSDLIVREHPQGFGAGFILNTNKPDWPKTDCWPTIEALCASGRCPLIRVHAVWDDGHAYKPRIHDPIMLREFGRTLELAKRHKAVGFEFSWLCENNMTAQQNREMVKRFGGYPVTLVNSIYKGAPVPGCKTEVHGTHAAPRGEYNYSFDGTHCFDADVQGLKAKHSRSDVFFFWCVQCNGRFNNKPKGTHGADETPRNLRRAWLYEKLLDSMIYLHRSPGEVSLKGNQIWKSHADQHAPKPSPRDNKPVLITPHDGPRAELVADNGQVVAVMRKEAADFNDGSRRKMYRLDSFGFEVAEKAVRIHGKPTVSLRIGGKVVGIVNPAFRAGSFRD